MNWLVSVVLFAVGVVLLFLLASGACIAAPVSAGASSAWEAVLEPLWNFDVVGASALFVAGLSICLGIAIPVWTIADRGRPTLDAARWSSVLLVAFLLNTFVGALCLLLLSLAWKDGAPSNTLGHLFALEVLFVLVGSYLAVSLLWLEKPIALFASTLSVHLLELGALVTVFVQGIRS